MALIDILQFASATSNVESQTAFAIDAPTGFVLGSNAASNIANKVLRQTSGITSALAQFVSNANNVTILDSTTPLTTASFLALLNTTFPTLQGPNNWSTNFELPITIGGISGSATNYAIKFNVALNKWQAGFFGDMALQNAGAVAITGGTISGLTTPLPVPSGGTGLASVATGNLLLGAGTAALAPLAPGANNNVLTSNGSAWVSRANNRLETVTDRTATRSQGVTYTNTTGSLILVLVTAGGGSGMYANVDGVSVINQFYDVNEGSGQYGRSFVFFPVPNNSTYSAGGMRSLVSWREVS